MNKPGNLIFGRLGIVGLIIAGIVLIWLLINQYGTYAGIDTTKDKLLALLAICLGIAFLCYLPAMAKGVKQSYHRRFSKETHALPAEESRLEKTSPRNITIDEIRHALRQHYGHFWKRKVRILLVTGSMADVERLTPGLTNQLWQEDRGTLLLWGGDPASSPDESWLTALKRLRRRPADAMIWVTSAIDHLADTSGVPATALPSAAAMDATAHALSARYEKLGWRLPLYVWSLHPRAEKQLGRMIQAVGIQTLTTGKIDKLLAELAAQLTTQGIQQAAGSPQHRFLLSLADQLTREPETLNALIAPLQNPYRPLPLAGLVFSPASEGAERAVPNHWGRDNRWDALPSTFTSLPAHLRPQRRGFSWSRLLASVACLAVIAWGAGLLVSFTTNSSVISNAHTQAMQAADTGQPLQQRLMALSDLQKTMQRLQHRAEHGAPWYSCLGLNQNGALLAALWPRYAQAALPLLRDAAATHLRKELQTVADLPPDSPLRDTLAKPAYAQLKLWLMLVRPERMDSAWFSQALMQDWAQRADVATGYWQGRAPGLLAFYGAGLVTHPEWKLKADPELTGQVRALLVRQLGVSNSESRLYQQVLAQVSRNYADMRLTDMTGDTDAALLFSTDEVVPGMFTRQAWDDGVKPAIDKVANARREEMDWVLGDNPPATGKSSSPDVLEAQLTSRYFADYSAAWLNFLNSLRLQPAPTLSDAIDQLTLMADVRQSPLVALMNTLNVQGRTGQTGGALADSLVKSAQNLFSKEKLPAIDQNAGPSGPLDATFGPLLSLTEAQGSSSSMNLRTFLTRVTQVRLRLQQVTNAADPQAMTQTLAQTVFQGKTVDLTETRDYGSLIAAGLGQEWSGFGQTVFVRPMEQAWQQVLSPAAESLNVQWQQAVVSEWNSAFGGRYPFKNVSSEVSLPLLAKYLNSDTGRITRFLQTRLNGVLHREGTRWVPDSINAQGLTFNPAFLKAINQLSQISDVVFTTGEAGLHFELRPGTAAGVSQTTLTIDSQKLEYVNQMPAWKRFTWPADTEAPGATLSWVSTEAGTRLYGDMPGGWGLIRLLDKAQVTANPGISSSWQLSWAAPDGRTLNYILRTEAGDGPLALLRLRNFTLPSDIFLQSATTIAPEDLNVTEDE
ncbi:ImcF-related family protein [Pantoea sp. X85]|uniref:ImcF-related family protein n=1 Tax=Pantoea sp. X85 TaxID=3037258 RepID=UPI0024135092|nr:ImcF-related family protein [Pantoea sp. X85]WFL65988.1 ImcF-related family protein [Pantoea sp. X85]